MKKLFPWICSFFLALTLFLSFTSLPTHAQQAQQNSRIGHLVLVPAAKNLALRKTAQLKQFIQSRSASHSLVREATTQYVTTPVWAGYVAGSGSGNGFKGVKATWNAPCTSGAINSQIGYGSWVGLGGAFGNGVFANPNGVEPLEQAGIALQSDGTYRLFWEYAPFEDPVIDQNDVIRCGQSITAWVFYGSDYCTNGGFYAHVGVNATNGAHWGSTCLTESQGLGTQSSEWIDERPGTIVCNDELADFNYTNWSNVLTQPNSSNAGWDNPDGFVNRQLFMYSGTTELADPDGVSVSSNNTFTDRWYHNGTFDCSV